MVLPRAVVPTFIAGLADPAVADACDLELRTVNEKYPDFFRAALLEGVRNMFLLVTRRAAFRAFDATAYADIERAAGRLYRMFRSRAVVRCDWLRWLRCLCECCCSVCVCLSPTGGLIFLCLSLLIPASNCIFTLRMRCAQVRNDFLAKLIDQLDKSVDVQQRYPRTQLLFPASQRMVR